MYASRAVNEQAGIQSHRQCRQSEVYTVERGQEVIVVSTFEGVNDRGEEGDVVKLTEVPGAT